MANEHINALKVGAVVEEYRIERLLGHGGFGMTYLARDLNLNTLVAIKEYLPQEFAVRAANSTIVPKSANDEQGYTWGLERFKQEARALARFKHPHIVRASRLIEANGTAYMVMDYEHGLTLGDYLKKHGPTLGEAHVLGVFLPILDGIHALHKAELVHRDIKPGNIYIRAEGGPMLIDFGAVRHAIGAHSRSLTAVVTPGFAPIEQYSSEGKQGPWTDLYAVGATMYTCILGRSPVDAARRSAAISDGDPDPLVSAARIGKGKYSDQFLAAVDWALQFRTRDRPQSALDFKDTLRKSPVRPEPLEFEEEDGDKTAMGAVPRETWAEPAANSAPRSKPIAAAEPPTHLSQPRVKGKMIPSGDADVASAPMEWFDPPPEEAAPASNPQNPPSKPKQMKTAPQPPRGQPTRDPDEDPLAQTNAGLISAAAAGELAPTPGKSQGKPDGKPAASPQAKADDRKADRSVAPAKPAAGGGLIANASARSAPPRSSGTWLKLGAAVLVLGAAGAGLWWYQSGATDRRDAKLWAAAGRSGSVAGYQSYLAGCENCAKRADAEAAIAELEAAARSEAESDALMQRIAELKARFVQHVMVGAIDQPAGDNARTVLDELGKLAPDDVFVISGRERLALMERNKGARSAPAPVAAPVAAPPAAGASAARTEVATTAPAPTKGKAAKDAKPAPAKAVAPAVDEDALLWDLLAKFEIALADKDIDGSPKSASVSLRALETLAPTDAMVRDARRRYDAIKAKADAAAARAAAAPPAPAVAAPAVVAAPVVAPPAASTPAASSPPASATPVPAPQSAPRAETPAPAAGTTVRDSLGALGSAPPLIVVPAGSFRMGDLQGVGNPDEQPVTTLRIRSFAISKREITVSQFRLFADTTRHVSDAERNGGCRVMRNGAWARDPNHGWRDPPFGQTDEEPVICVSATDAGAYAAWLSSVTGAKYRLPTEAEWEYAARAGSESAWWWGASPSGGQANCQGCEGRTRDRTLEVGGYSKNAWGLFDTAGNVWEWTCSAYSPRLGAGEDKCVNLGSEDQIVMRGGSWATPVERLRSSSRGYAAMSYTSDNVGFRVVREY